MNGIEEFKEGLKKFNLSDEVIDNITETVAYEIVFCQMDSHRSAEWLDETRARVQHKYYMGP